MATFKVSGMKSPDCVAAISEVVKIVDRIEVLTVNYTLGELTYRPTKCIDPEIIDEMIKEACGDPESN